MTDNISNIDNYRSILNESSYSIFSKLNEICIQYVNHFTTTNNLSKTNSYIFLKGLQCVLNVFYFILLYTKNIELSFNHSKQSILYYVEFIQQIGDDNQGFLQLSSKDAVIFVYKKTIFDINTEAKKKHSINKDEKLVVKFMESSIDYIISFISFILDKDVLDKETIVLNINKLIDIVKDNDNIYFYYKKVNVINVILKKLITFHPSFDTVMDIIISLKNKIGTESGFDEDITIKNINGISDIKDILKNPMRVISF